VNRLRLLAFCLLTAMSTTACDAAQPVPQPEPKRNPAPTEVYEITVTIKDAPGPFDSIDGFTQFDVLNDECVPLDYTAALGGVRNNPSERVPVKYERIGDGVYRATVVADALVDEDYYGLGMCHWTLVATNFIANAGSKIAFVSYLTGDNLTNAEAKNSFYSTLFYQDRNTIEFDMSVSGESGPDKFGPNVPLFEILIAPTRK
jgi:hypothetical protein